MARYRPIDITIWEDEDEFLKYSDAQKILFFYLITNSKCTESGIYKLAPGIVAFTLKWKEEKFIKTIVTLKPNVFWDNVAKIVFVKNFYKYNGKKHGNPKYIKQSIAKDYENFATPLWHCFLEAYPYFVQTFENFEQSIIEYDYEYTIESSNKESSNVLASKIPYSDCVKMYEGEYSKLVGEHGKDMVEKFIAKLNNHKSSKGVKYKSDYHTILNWVIGAVKGETKPQKTKGGIIR